MVYQTTCMCEVKTLIFNETGIISFSIATMRRSNTKDVSTFNLPPPNAVTFTFPPPSPDSSVPNIRITIADSSQWRMPLHWHLYEGDVPGCQQLTCVSGVMHVFTMSGWG